MFKKLITIVVSALMLTGCAATNTLKENSKALTTSLRVKTTAAALRTVNEKTDAQLVAPNLASHPFAETKEEEEKIDVKPTDFSDFTDFYDNGVPKDANFPAIKYMEGNWKYYLDMQNLDISKVEFKEFGLADVSLNTIKETVIIKLHPQMAGDEFELYPETEEEVGYKPFEGGFDENGSLKLTGNNVTMYISSYFAWSGREYVMGEIWYQQEGHWGLFLLTRGQE